MQRLFKELNLILQYKVAYKLKPRRKQSHKKPSSGRVYAKW